MKLVAVLVACVAVACATRATARWSDVDGHEPPKIARASTAPPPPPPAPPAPPAPPEPAPPPTPRALAPGDIVIDGKAVDDGAIVDVPAMELACLVAADALVDGPKAKARFESMAEKEQVPLGRIGFVRLERDPARSLTDPPPHWCRNVASRSYLKAPLFREHEAAARWLVKRLSAGIAADAATLIAATLTKNLDVTAHPRVLVDDAGVPVAVAVPVAEKGGT